MLFMQVGIEFAQWDCALHVPMPVEFTLHAGFARRTTPVAVQTSRSYGHLYEFSHTSSNFVFRKCEVALVVLEC